MPNTHLMLYEDTWTISVLIFNLLFNACRDNHLTLNNLLPFENTTILRLQISGNPSLNGVSRQEILRKLHQVWVINDDFVKTDEGTSWGVSDENIFRSGGWMVPQEMSDHQREMFDIVINQVPQKKSSADYFKLDYLLDDYLFQAFVHNSAPGTILGESKPMPIVNCNDILLMKHQDRLDLAVLLTTKLFYRVPDNVFKDTMEKLLVSYMSLKAIKDLSLLPTFAITALVSLIIRICRRELLELDQYKSLASKSNIPFLVHGECLFSSTNSPSRDSSGFRFLKSVRHFLSRGLHHEMPKSGVRQSEYYSEMEHEILRTLNDIPTKASFPASDTKAFQEWIPFVARHTLVMMTKVSSCPPLTRCQTSLVAQQTYNELTELLSAAGMTYEDMNVSANGPDRDGRDGMNQSQNVLSFGTGLPKSTYNSLTWNKSILTREYEKPWSEKSASAVAIVTNGDEIGDEEIDDESAMSEGEANNIESQVSNDIADLSVGGDDILDPSPSRSKRSLSEKSSKIPFLKLSSEGSGSQKSYALEDDLDDMPLTPSSSQVEGRPWSMTLQTSLRSKSLESLYLTQGDSISEKVDTVLSPIEAPFSERPQTRPMSSGQGLVTGFSSEQDKVSQFVLASPSKIGDWKVAAGKKWKEIDLAPVLVHPLSKYPVYIHRKTALPSGNSTDDEPCEYDIVAGEKKDWMLHVKEQKALMSTLELENADYLQYHHVMYEELKRNEEIKNVTNQLEDVEHLQGATSKILQTYVQSKDPNQLKNELLKEMGTTRNIRFQKEMASNLKKEIERQRRMEEERRQFSYLGIKLEGGSSLLSQESFATLETKESSLKSKSSMKMGVDLNRVSWNTFVKKEPKLPSLEVVEKVAEAGAFLTDLADVEISNKSQPPSPSKAVLSYTPKPVAHRPDHIFNKQDSRHLGDCTITAWDPNIPLTKHVRNALKYSSVYTNSGEVDWGTVLAGGKQLSNWYPRQEKVTYTLGEQDPVNVARMEHLGQSLQLPPTKHPPPPVSSVYPIPSKSMVVDKTHLPQSSSNDDPGNGPVSNRGTSRRRIFRPDKSRAKVREMPKRLTAPAVTSNFTNYTLRERDPIFVEITEMADGSTKSLIKDNDSIFDGSVHSQEIKKEYSLTISVTESATGELLSRAESPDHRFREDDSLGSASLSCGSNGVKQVSRRKRQQQEVIVTDTYLIGLRCLNHFFLMISGFVVMLDKEYSANRSVLTRYSHAKSPTQFTSATFPSFYHQVSV